MRLDIRRIETLKEGTEAVGNRVRVKIVKNKVAPPFKQAEFDIAYGEGISWEGTVLDVGLEHKIVTKSGSYFSYGDERLGQGRTNSKAFLVEHPDVTNKILDEIQVKFPDVIVPRRSASPTPPTSIPAKGELSDAARRDGAGDERHHRTRRAGRLRPAGRSPEGVSVERVSSISASRRRAGGAEIVLGSGERLVVSTARLARFGLARDDLIEDGVIVELRTAARLDGLEQRLLRLVAIRARSRAELDQRLERWQVATGERRELLDRLSTAGLLDDRAFAHQLSSTLQRRGHGSARAAL